MLEPSQNDSDEKDFLIGSISFIECGQVRYFVSEAILHIFLFFIVNRL